MFQPNDMSDSSLDQREPRQGEYVFLKSNDTNPLEVIRVRRSYYIVYNEQAEETATVYPDDLTGEIAVKRATPLRSDANPLHEALVRNAVTDMEHAYKGLQIFGSAEPEITDETRHAVYYCVIQLINHAAFYKFLPSKFKFNKGLLVDIKEDEGYHGNQ